MAIRGLSEALMGRGCFYVEKGFLKIAWPTACYVCKRKNFACVLRFSGYALGQEKSSVCGFVHRKLFRVRKSYGKKFRLPVWQEGPNNACIKGVFCIRTVFRLHKNGISPVYRAAPMVQQSGQIFFIFKVHCGHPRLPCSGMIPAVFYWLEMDVISISPPPP